MEQTNKKDDNTKYLKLLNKIKGIVNKQHQEIVNMINKEMEKAIR